MNGFTYQIRAIITEIFVYELRLHVYIAKLNIWHIIADHINKGLQMLSILTTVHWQGLTELKEKEGV